MRISSSQSEIVIHDGRPTVHGAPAKIIGTLSYPSYTVCAVTKEKGEKKKTFYITVFSLTNIRSTIMKSGEARPMLYMSSKNNHKFNI